MRVVQETILGEKTDVQSVRLTTTEYKRLCQAKHIMQRLSLRLAEDSDQSTDVSLAAKCLEDLTENGLLIEIKNYV